MHHMPKSESGSDISQTKCIFSTFNGFAESTLEEEMKSSSENFPIEQICKIAAKAFFSISQNWFCHVQQNNSALQQTENLMKKR